MMTKRVALGLPIQLMYRMVNVGAQAGGVVNAALTAAAGLTLAIPIAQAIVPSLTSALGKDSAQPANALGATSLNPLDALLTFFDFGANVLEISEKRRLSIVDVPGREGDFIQNLGSKSVRYKISGRFFAVDQKGTSTTPFSNIFRGAFDNNVAVGNTQLLRMLERTGVPAPFVCEYDMAEVIVENLDLKLVGGNPEWINYTIDLIEYRRLPQLVKMLGLAGLGLVG